MLGKRNSVTVNGGTDPGMETRPDVLAATGRQLSRPLLMLLSAAISVSAWAADFAPNEIMISKQTEMFDLEFSQSRSQFTWVDKSGSLWIGNVNRTTGMFDPPDGRGILVDPDAMATKDVWMTWNGPEWVSTSRGDQIVYTKFLPNLPHAPENARIGIAAEVGRNRWSSGFLGPSLARLAPYGSETPNDPSPIITYIDIAGNHYWRELTNPLTEEMLPGGALSPRPARSARGALGARDIIYTVNVNGTMQVVRYDIHSKLLEQLTFDEGQKISPFMWQAPEYGNEFLLMVLINKLRLRVYREIPIAVGKAMAWSPIFDVPAPPGSEMVSPEPFVYNGKSYIFTAMIASPNDFPTEIWISNIDSQNLLFRRISENSRLRMRIDPEVFITSHGPFIYYQGFDPTVIPGQPYCCAEGVFRTDPGLASLP